MVNPKALDQKVQKYIHNLRAAGTPVNRSIVIAAARGVVLHDSPSLLPENSGNIDLGRKWAESIMTLRHHLFYIATNSAIFSCGTTAVSMQCKCLSVR